MGWNVPRAANVQRTYLPTSHLTLGASDRMWPLPPERKGETEAPKKKGKIN